MIYNKLHELKGQCAGINVMQSRVISLPVESSIYEIIIMAENEPFSKLILSKIFVEETKRGTAFTQR